MPGVTGERGALPLGRISRGGDWTRLNRVEAWHVGGRARNLTVGDRNGGGGWMEPTKNVESISVVGVPVSVRPDSQSRCEDERDTQRHELLPQEDRGFTEMDSPNKTPGRPKSLPSWASDRVLQLHAAGLGYRRISAELRNAGLDASPWSVRRAIKGLPPYDSLSRARARDENLHVHERKGP